MTEQFPLLSCIVWIPLIAGLLVWLPVFRGTSPRALAWSRSFCTLAALVTFALSLAGAFAYDVERGGMQFAESVPWIPGFGISYGLGMDGFASVLALLTAGVAVLCVAWPRWWINSERGYLSGLLLTEGAILGAFLATDVFLFYVFFELMLVPAYFLVGVFGGRRRIPAALKFVVYTVAGSVVMFVAMLYLVWTYFEQFGTVSFALEDLRKVSTLGTTEQIVLYGAFLLALAIKIPIVPFHSWLPDLYVEAPTAVTVLLAALLGKVGLYALVRFALPLFPLGAHELAPVVAALGAIGVVYGALIAWAQEDMKRLLAYSSISHLGFCVLGVAAGTELALTGALFQMVSHGIVTGALFLLVGFVTDESRSRGLDAWEGLAAKAPRLAVLLMVFVLGAVALPLTSGFVGEFMILAGAFKSYMVWTLVALAGVIFGAVYMLRLYGLTMFGGARTPDASHSMSDLGWRELVLAVPAAVLVLFLGLFPEAVLSRVAPAARAIESVVTRLDAGERIGQSVGSSSKESRHG